MLSQRIVAIARGRGVLRTQHLQNASRLLMAQFHSSRLLQAETVKVPQMAESISEGTLKTWSKQVGDTVAADEEVATIETDKIDVSVNAPQAGTIVKLLANEEDTVAVGQDLFISNPVSALCTPPPKETKEEAEPTELQSEKAPPPPSHPAQPTKSRNETRVKMNRMRLRIAERLKQSQDTAASLTTFNEIDMSALVEMRKKYKQSVLDEHGVKLGFMSFFARACSLALKEIPAANASIDGEDIVFRDYIDLRLVTPVVRNAESMGMIEIEKEIAALGAKARANKLTLEDMAGGTFTISNGGVFGSLFGTPIINLPQAAVFGMHAINDRPVAINGQVVIRPIMIVALTYDHRLLDGREAVTFLVKVKQYLEDPAKMLLTV
ncbi:dihydrolipoyllysine-residue succinyltransferase 1 [Pholiota molesta]|nr:dihydrolipoyllysine-residue succinyltransferase 1 [Pholiota molesta]